MIMMRFNFRKLVAVHIRLFSYYFKTGIETIYVHVMVVTKMFLRVIPSSSSKELARIMQKKIVWKGQKQEYNLTALRKQTMKQKINILRHLPCLKLSNNLIQMLLQPTSMIMMRFNFRKLVAVHIRLFSYYFKTGIETIYVHVMVVTKMFLRVIPSSSSKELARIMQKKIVWKGQKQEYNLTALRKQTMKQKIMQKKIVR